jgi:hypothetical protein
MIRLSWLALTTLSLLGMAPQPSTPRERKVALKHLHHLRVKIEKNEKARHDLLIATENKRHEKNMKYLDIFNNEITQLSFVGITHGASEDDIVVHSEPIDIPNTPKEKPTSTRRSSVKRPTKGE